MGVIGEHNRALAELRMSAANFGVRIDKLIVFRDGSVVVGPYVDKAKSNCESKLGDKLIDGMKKMEEDCQKWQKRKRIDSEKKD